MRVWLCAECVKASFRVGLRAAIGVWVNWFLYNWMLVFKDRGDAALRIFADTHRQPSAPIHTHAYILTYEELDPNPYPSVNIKAG